jgi:methanethiol S-methyltransferase
MGVIGLLAKACGGIAFALFVHLWWRSGGARFAGLSAGPFWVDLAGGHAAAWDLALLAFFFAAHSGFASMWFKLRVTLPRASMRRLYLVLTLPVTLIMWAAWAPLARPVLWDGRGILATAFLVVRLVALAGLVWTVRSFSLADFFGDRGAASGVATEGHAGGHADGDDRPTTLSTGGAFTLCRHPLYFFMILLAAATTLMPLGRALMAGALLVYVAVGSRLEERKLEAEFGAAYTRYRARTPWLIPTFASIARAFRGSSRAGAGR